VPDGSTTDQQGQQPPQPPLPPDQQIKQQISLGQVTDWLGNLFGAGGWEPTAGGGGTGGQFMFASIDELNTVIQQWQTELAAITADGIKVGQAISFVQAPAGDDMSTGQANATRDSLVKLQEHNNAMRDYAQKYLEKLIASRDHIVATEANNQTRMQNVNRS
jgi:hypothetical protein